MKLGTFKSWKKFGSLNDIPIRKVCKNFFQIDKILEKVLPFLALDFDLNVPNFKETLKLISYYNFQDNFQRDIKN